MALTLSPFDLSDSRGTDGPSDCEDRLDYVGKRAQGADDDEAKLVLLSPMAGSLDGEIAGSNLSVSFEGLQERLHRKFNRAAVPPSPSLCSGDGCRSHHFQTLKFKSTRHFLGSPQAVLRRALKIAG